MTCFSLDSLSRENLLDCMRKRRHYGTTGGPNGRMIIDVEAGFDAPGTVYCDDPKLFENPQGTTARHAKMGDIVHLPVGSLSFSGRIETTSPIERIEIFNGTKLIQTVRPYDTDTLGARVCVLWEGAEYRGRFRQVIWDGTAQISGNTVLDVRPVNFLNRDKVLSRHGNHLSWEALTTGNFGGIDIRLEDATSGRLKFETPLVSFDMPISDIKDTDLIFDEGDRLPRFVRVLRVPETLTRTSQTFSVSMDLVPTGDNPIYLRLTQEDGTRAWTSAIYIYR